MERSSDQQLAALSAIASAAGPATDLESALQAILQRTIETLRVDGGWIALAGEPDRILAHHGISADYAAALAESETETTVDNLLQDREMVSCEDAEASSLATAASTGEGIRSMVALRLRLRRHARGLLVIVARQPRTLSADDVHFIAVAGALAAAAIERSPALQDRSSGERDRRLLEAAETLNRSLEAQTLETTILAEAARLLDAHKAALFLARGDVLVAQEVYGLSDRYRQLSVVPLEGSAWGRAVISGETIAIDDMLVEDPAAAVLTKEGAYRSFLAAPLESHRGTYGALSIFSDEVARFGEDEKTLLQTFAIQAAIALDNRRLMQEKDQMAVHDGLTGVYNRSHLEMALERTKKELRRYGGTVSILFFDLDGMKSVNDTHGHEAGDRLLCELAALLVKTCRESDIVARYGGDEFVVLMPGTDANGARRVALKTQEAIARRNRDAPDSVPLSASMGLHAVTAADMDDLLREADRRMYAMKEARHGGKPRRAGDADGR